MNELPARGSCAARAGGARAALAALLCLAALVPALAQTQLSGQEVMDRVFAAPKPKTSVLTMTMLITKGGRSLSRSLTTWSTGDTEKGETEKTLMKFLSPADVKGAGFLNLKKPDGSTESLLWLPALGRVRRLGSGASDQDQAFFGSDFTNRDINGFVKADFTYEVSAFSGGLYTVVAAPKKSLGYDKLVYSVDSTNWRYVKIEYWRSGRLAKTQSLSYAPVGAYLMPSKITMSSASGSATELSFTDYKLDQKLGEELFTERFLKQ